MAKTVTLKNPIKKPSSKIALGWDLGGAHLKAAFAKNQRLQAIKQLPCPLWQGLEQLEQAVAEVLQDWPETRQAHHRITMTAELVDLFDNRVAGVNTLCKTMCELLPAAQIAFYGGQAGLIPAAQVVNYTEQIASANWLASSGYAAQNLVAGVLLDIGSTTTDVLIFAEGRVLSASISDADRLSRAELIYTGVVRTPVCAITDQVPFQGQWQTLAAEFFATMADVYRLLNWLPDNTDLLPSADGRGKSITESTARLARMLGRDADHADPRAWQQVAAYIARRQLGKIQDGLDQVLSRYPVSPDAAFIGAGCGRFLVTRLAELYQRPYLDFAELCTTGSDADLARAAADCAPAVALALGRYVNS